MYPGPRDSPSLAGHGPVGDREVYMARPEKHAWVILLAPRARMGGAERRGRPISGAEPVRGGPYREELGRDVCIS